MDTDPAATPARKRTRRGNPRPPTGERTSCVREGCNRIVPRHRVKPACSILCELVITELAEAQRMCAATGDGELWSAAVGLNDALTAYRCTDSRVYHAAREVGITDDQWRAIKRGDSDSDLPRPTTPDTTARA
jgi:hypothetical protein